MSIKRMKAETKARCRIGKQRWYRVISHSSRRTKFFFQ